MAKKAGKHIPTNLPAAGTPVSDKRQPWRFSFTDFRTQALILILTGFIFYGNTFSNENAFDDRMAITDNEYVQKGFAGIPDILTKDAYQCYLEHRNGTNQLSGGRYRPLSLITFAIEQQVMGPHNDDSRGTEDIMIQEMHARHVVNVLLYIVSVVVILYFLRKIVFPEEPLTAFIATLLFTVHPLHTEVVANVKSRDEILSLLFITLTFLKAFRYRETKKRKDLLYALLCFFLALMSKEYAATLLLLLPLSFYVFAKETLKGTVRYSLLYLVPFAVYLLLRFNAVTAAPAGAENNVLNNPYLYASGIQRLASEVMVLLEYLKLLVFPNVLAADYSYAQIPYAGLTNMAVYLSLIINLALLAIMFVLLRKRHPLSFALAFYSINLLLVSNILFNIGAPMGERLIYHSSLGFTIAAGFLLCRGFARLNIATISKYGLAGFSVLLVIVSGFKTIERNADWKNDETLFLTDVQKVPNSALANNNAAAACMNIARKNKENVPVRNDWFEKAIRYFDKAISIYPQYMMPYLNRGLSYYNMGRPDSALRDWDTVRKYAPQQQNLEKYLDIAGKYFYSRGLSYSRVNQYDSAVYAFSRSTEASPALADGWLALARCYLALQKYTEAGIAAEKAMQLAPNSEDVRKVYQQVLSVIGPQ